MGFEHENTWPKGAAREAYEEHEESPEVTVYRERLGNISQKQKELEEVLTMLHDDEDMAAHFSEAQLHELIDKKAGLAREYIEASANYPGDWTALLFERMRDPKTKERFVNERKHSIAAIMDSVPGYPNSEEMGRVSQYEREMAEYDNNLDYVFSYSEVGPAHMFGRSPQHAGKGGMTQVGTVFSDGTHKGELLNSKQRNIIESHEKGHGVRTFMAPLDTREIRSVIDHDALDVLTEHYRTLEREGKKEGHFRSEYIKKPNEIIERMSQFKNYFGMGAANTFTKAHLDYVREHYKEDTGYDNGVGDLLTCITPETEGAFLKVINQYPV